MFICSYAVYVFVSVAPYTFNNNNVINIKKFNFPLKKKN